MPAGLLATPVPDAVALCGDFNLCSEGKYVPENAPIAGDRDVLDLWPALRPGEPGWTEDTEANAMRYRATGKEKQVRFDRVLLVRANAVDENRGGARTPAATAGWERARAHK